MKGAKAGNTDNDLGPSSPPPGAATSEEHGCRDGEDAAEEPLEDEKDSEDEEPGGDIAECEPLESQIDGEIEEGIPKLADGYYEIEAVRRKRIRKGKAQYLIKWRGWAESANTWEPAANLRHCSDVIDAFEGSSKSGRICPTRKRKKRKNGVVRVQKKRKQLLYNPERLSPSAATYSVPSHIVGIIEEPASMPEKANNKDGTATIVGFGSVTRVEKDVDELDLKLCEIARESRSRRRDEVGLVRSSGPCIGAKKRKSGPVRRFKKKEALSSVAGDGVSGLPPIRVVQHREFGDSCRRALEDSKSLWNITEIIRPVNYSASSPDGAQEIYLAFEALRSDGTKVIVDNKILKANNPLMLIDYYEKHITYTPK